MRRTAGNHPPDVYGGARLYHERLGISTALFKALPQPVRSREAVWLH